MSDQPPTETDQPTPTQEAVLDQAVAIPAPEKHYFWGTGRRKTATARVRIKPGEGKFEVNGVEREKYFAEMKDRNAVIAPLQATQTLGKIDVFCNVKGGGHTGQAGAITLGVARALNAADKELEKALRDGGFLTRDPRMVERKKYGQRGARRRFQFSKR